MILWQGRAKGLGRVSAMHSRSHQELWSFSCPDEAPSPHLTSYGTLGKWFNGSEVAQFYIRKAGDVSSIGKDKLIWFEIEHLKHLAQQAPESEFPILHERLDGLGRP